MMCKILHLIFKSAYSNLCSVEFTGELLRPSQAPTWKKKKSCKSYHPTGVTDQTPHAWFDFSVNSLLWQCVSSLSNGFISAWLSPLYSPIVFQLATQYFPVASREWLSENVSSHDFNNYLKGHSELSTLTTNKTLPREAGAIFFFPLPFPSPPLPPSPFLSPSLPFFLFLATFLAGKAGAIFKYLLGKTNQNGWVKSALPFMVVQLPNT